MKSTTPTRAWALGLALTVLGATSEAQSPPPVPSPSPQKKPVVGDVIPAFDAEALDGSLQHIEFAPGSTTVLIFFLSGCPHCRKMIPEWNDAYSQRPSSLRVLGIIMDREPPGFFSMMPVTFPVVRSPGLQFLHGLNIVTAPVTMRVVAGGKVTDVAVGVVDPIELGGIFRR